MRARQEYLKQQRDKLLALKKQVRERRLGAAEGAESAGNPDLYFEPILSSLLLQNTISFFHIN